MLSHVMALLGHLGEGGCFLGGHGNTTCLGVYDQEYEVSGDIECNQSKAWWCKRQQIKRPST